MRLFYEAMYTALGLVGLFLVIVFVIALAAGVTWLVVKISPTTVGGKKPVAKNSDS
jgi:hypothetical protein